MRTFPIFWQMEAKLEGVGAWVWLPSSEPERRERRRAERPARSSSW